MIEFKVKQEANANASIEGPQIIIACVKRHYLTCIFTVGSRLSYPPVTRTVAAAPRGMSLFVITTRSFTSPRVTLDVPVSASSMEPRYWHHHNGTVNIFCLYSPELYYAIY